MKKIAAIFLLTIYLFSATDLRELLKAEVFIDHWHEHQKYDSSVSLYQFLVMHYVTDDNNNKDNERDNQLPFKSPVSCVSNYSFVSITDQFSSTSFQFFAIDANDFLTVDVAFVISSFPALVWHPPQFS